MKFAAWYCLIVGVLILISWLFFFVAGQVPEVQTEPYRIATHLVAEAATAAALIVAGIGLLQQRAWAAPAALVALGMLLYTVINSPGYFAQQGAWPLVAMFVALLILALVSLRLLFRAL
jgi:hypothetical protein